MFRSNECAVLGAYVVKSLELLKMDRIGPAIGSAVVVSGTLRCFQ